MKKEQPLRDKNGRFMKKAKASSKKQTKRTHPTKEDYGKVADWMCERGEIIIRAELINQLQNERDCYKRLSERLGSDYLNKCKEYGKLKCELNAYKDNWPALKNIARHWKNKAQKLDESNNFLLDAFRGSASFCDRLIDMLPRWRYRLHLKEINARMGEVTYGLLHAEGLDRE